MLIKFILLGALWGVLFGLVIVQLPPKGKIIAQVTINGAVIAALISGGIQLRKSRKVLVASRKELERHTKALEEFTAKLPPLPPPTVH